MASCIQTKSCTKQRKTTTRTALFAQVLNIQSLTNFFHVPLLYLSRPSSRAGIIRCAQISLFLQKTEIIYVLFNPESFDLNWKILSSH